MMIETLAVCLTLLPTNITSRDEHGSGNGPFWPALAALSPPAPPSPSSLLFKKIKTAKNVLAKIPLKSKRAGSDNAILAVMNTETNKILLIRIQNDRTYRFEVARGKRNGVATTFVILHPPNFVVLATKTTVKKRLSKKHWVLQSAIYTPYSPPLDNENVRAAGLDYLRETIARAKKSLEEKAVSSRAENKIVTETVPERVLLTLLIIEHIDPEDFALWGVEKNIGKVLVTLAANREDAYKWSRSSASALGLAQFIPSSYKMTRKNYPEAKLRKDFWTGMTTHQNAVMAQYCIADFSLIFLEEAARMELRKNEEEFGAYLAAAYNGGGRRASYAFKRWGDDWDTPQGKDGLRQETVNYVRIFREVYRFLKTQE